MRRWLSLFCLLVLLIVTLVFFHKIFTSRQALFGGDLELARSRYGFAARMLRTGHLPLWNPYELSGYPAAASTQPAILYPPNLMFLFLPTDSAINLSIFIHFFAGAAFMYLFLACLSGNRAAALMGALVFAFNTFFLVRVISESLFLVLSLPWIGLIFYFLEKGLTSGRWRYYVLAGFFYAMQGLSGYMQLCFYTGLALATYFLFSLATGRVNIGGGRGKIKVLKKFAPLGLIFIIAGSLAAVQILPTFELVTKSSRGETPLYLLAEESLPPENLVTFLIPDFFGDSVNSPYWGRGTFTLLSAYFGILPLGLSLLAVVVRREGRSLFFLFLGLICLIFSMGEHTPLYQLLGHIVPGTFLFRMPSKFVYLTVFSFSVLSTLGADCVIKGLPGKSPQICSLRLAKIFSLAAAALALLIGLCYLLGQQYSPLWLGLLRWRHQTRWQTLQAAPFSPLQYQVPSITDEKFISSSFAVAFRGSLLLLILLLASAGLFIVLSRWPKGKLSQTSATHRKRNLIAATAMALLIIFDLFLFGQRFIILSPKDAQGWDDEVVAALAHDPDIFRVATPSGKPDVYQPGTGYDLSNIGGERSLMLLQYQEFMNVSNGRSIKERSSYLTPLRFSPLLSLLNVKYVVLDRADSFMAKMWRDVRLKKVLRTPRFTVYENTDFLPRAYIVHNVIHSRVALQTLNALMSPAFDGRNCAIIYDRGEKTFVKKSPSRPEERVEILSFAPDRLSLEATVYAHGLLVLSEIYYPGWMAYVDGKKEEVLQANHILRAVEIESGEHRIEFVFRPMSFIIGAVISVITLSALGVFFLAKALARKS